MDSQTHWEKIYKEKAPDAVSWYRPHLETSLALKEKVVTSRSAFIIDVGGGESTLVDDLLTRGYENITVLDIAQTAIDANKRSRSGWLIFRVPAFRSPTRKPVPSAAPPGMRILNGAD